MAWVQYWRLVSCLSAEIPSGMSVPQPAASNTVYICTQVAWQHTVANRLLATSKLASNFEHSQLRDCQ